MDSKAKAGFIGLTLRHGPGHLVRALLEGVAFALRQIVDTMVGCGADLTRLVASGNGLANPFWRQIVADVLNRPLCQGTGEQASERAGVGAAMVAGIGAGVFTDYEDARKLAPVITAVTEPTSGASGLYESHYRRFVDAYPRLRGSFWLHASCDYSDQSDFRLPSRIFIYEHAKFIAQTEVMEMVSPGNLEVPTLGPCAVESPLQRHWAHAREAGRFVSDEDKILVDDALKQRRRLKDVIEYQKKRRTFLR
jgi:hypothetical protein